MLRDAVLGEARAQWRQMVPRDGLVSDDDGLPPAHQRQDRRPGPRDQARSDQNVVTPLPEFDTQRFDGAGGGFRRRHCMASGSGGSSARGQPASAAMTRVVVASAGPSPLSMTMSASA